MSQRIRNCSKSTNFETINCESYLTRLLHRDKVASKFKKERPFGNAKTSNVDLLAPTNPKIKTVKLKPLVVRGTACNKPNREPWNKLLKSTKSATTTSFDQFDPLRTIHFLSKELQSKLRSMSSSDPQVLYMLSTMQQALDRIPPDVSMSTLPLKQSEIRTCNSKTSVNNIEDLPEKLVTEPLVVHKSCQTHNVISYTDSEIFQKKLESSTAKLETSCKQMEMLCQQLKNEKQFVEELLQIETNKVAQLKQQLEALQNQKNEFSNAALDKVVRERQELENKLKQLKVQVSSYHGPTIQELKTRVHDLQTQKMNLEQDNIALRHKLTSSDMEREKFVTMVKMRDRHINELLNEMNFLQEVVSEQLLQLQKVPLISSPSSQSTMLDNIPSLPWPDVDFLKVEESKDSVEPSKNQDIVPMHELYSKALRELESGDNSTTNVALKTTKAKTKSAPFLSKDNVLKSAECGENVQVKNLTSIHELFDELRQQAMALNVPHFSVGIKTSGKSRLNCFSEPSTP